MRNGLGSAIAHIQIRSIDERRNEKQGTAIQNSSAMHRGGICCQLSRTWDDPTKARCAPRSRPRKCAVGSRDEWGDVAKIL